MKKGNKNFTPHNLEPKLIKLFDKEIKFFIIENKKLVAPKHLISVDEQSYENLKNEDMLHKSALLLRKSILQIGKKKLQHIKVQNL